MTTASKRIKTIARKKDVVAHITNNGDSLDADVPVRKGGFPQGPGRYVGDVWQSRNSWGRHTWIWAEDEQWELHPRPKPVYRLSVAYTGPRQPRLLILRRAYVENKEPSWFYEIESSGLSASTLYSGPDDPNFLAAKIKFEEYEDSRIESQAKSDSDPVWYG